MANRLCISRDIYNIVKDDYLEPYLQERGFVQTRKDWFHLIQGDVCSRISTGFMRDGPVDQGILTLCVGIGFFSLDRFLKSFPLMEETIKIYRGMPCAIARDVALMRTGHVDDWWIYPSSDPAEVARLAIGHLSAEGFDYFENYGTLDKFLDAMERRVELLNPWAIYYRAAAYWLRGERDRIPPLFGVRRRAMNAEDARTAIYKEPDPNDGIRTIQGAEGVVDWLSQLPTSRGNDRIRAEHDSFLAWLAEQPTELPPADRKRVK